MSPLKRSPLKRGKPLVTKNPLKQGGRVKPVSDKKKQQVADTKDVRALYVKEHPWCEIGAPGCTRQALACHERLKRSQGGSLVDPANLMACCFLCNGFIEDNPRLARERGWVVKSWEQPADVPCQRREQ